MKRQLFFTIFISIFLCCQVFAAGTVVNRGATNAEATAQERDDKWLSPANIPSIMATPGNIGETTASNATFQDTITLKDANGTHIIKSVLEPGLDSRFTIGVDEVARTMVICDAGDVDTDFGLGVSASPALYIFDPAGASAGSLKYDSLILRGVERIKGYSAETVFNGSPKILIRPTSDLAVGNIASFDSGAGIELTDTNAEQSWIYIEPKINQSDTAAYNGFKIKVTETALGDASTGDGGGTNNLILAGTSTDPDMFKVGSDGNVTIQGSLTVNGTITANDYAEHNSAFAYMSTSGTQTIDSNATFEKLDEGTIAYTAGNLENFTHSDGRLTYTGTLTKHFFATVNLSIQSGETAQTVQIRLAKNGATIAGTNMSTDFTAQTKDGCAGLNWLFSLATNDYIEVFGVSDTDGDTFDVNNMTISIMNEN